MLGPVYKNTFLTFSGIIAYNVLIFEDIMDIIDKYSKIYFNSFFASNPGNTGDRLPL